VHTSDFQAIEEVRSRLGPDLCILAHHYQHDAVVQHADYTGDSLELARRIPQLGARFIVMCGVYFMAETAAILATKGQFVYIPEEEAGCNLSWMAPAGLVQSKLAELERIQPDITPLAYVNTSAAVKALCGRYGGSVCTSANAVSMMRWAFDRGDGILFLPDRNLGHNAADSSGVAQEARSVLSLRQPPTKRSEMHIWPGVCVVHHLIKPEYIERVRRDHPQAHVIVHPECTPEVVALADASGSTSSIIRYVADAPEGSTIFVGTEVNMVHRLARQYEGHKDVRVLCARSVCGNMAKITETGLAGLLRNLDRASPVRVDEEAARDSLQALDRMLQACS
jgi:quinolinate synthase